ncbi:MAG: GTP cyclohydrolase II, partial [Armatimonadetes bacterium]|nr:GTP cyclohydrolase II [Armatimonadota bacterium]
MATSTEEFARAYAQVEEAARRLRNGEFVIAVDDEGPTNTGDLILAAEFATADRINFIMREARGLICVAMLRERLEELGLPLIPSDPGDRSRPAFATPVDARSGVSTGDSAEDRAVTIRLLISPDTSPHDLVRPGHVQPVQAAPGGVLQRTGHTEAAVDLCRLAGLYPAAVTCQILDDRGCAAELGYLRKFAERFGIHIVSIADIIRYRRRTEKLVERVAEAELPTIFGQFRAVVYRSLVDNSDYLAVIKGDLSACDAPLVRVHSGCITGDALGSLKCDCGWQLHAALQKIEEAGCGVVLYIASHEGRGIGLVNKIRAYHFQDRGLDTVEANLALGLPADVRDYGLGAQVLSDLGIRRMRLMTNNPHKYAALQGYGLEVVERVPLEAPATEYNWRYLLAKRQKMGHLINPAP